MSRLKRIAQQITAVDHESAFHAEIKENPSDPAPRLIYADWLEDHGDPLANFIRYLEEGVLHINVEKELWGYGQGGSEAQSEAAMSFPELQTLLSNGLYDWSTMEERPHILYESLSHPEDVEREFPGRHPYDPDLVRWEGEDDFDEEEYMITVELQKDDGTPWTRRELDYLYRALGLYAAHYLHYENFPEDE